MARKLDEETSGTHDLPKQDHNPKRQLFHWVLPGKIQARLFLLISLALLPVLLLIGWIYEQRYEAQRVQELQTQMEVAQGGATIFAAYLEGVRQQSYAVGQAILTFSPYSDAKTTRLLRVTAAEYPTFRNLNWVSPEGTVIASSLPALVGRDLSVRPYFQKIQAGQPWAIGDLTPQGVATNAPTVGIGTAIRNENGELRGVVVAGVEPTRLDELAFTPQRPTGGTYTIFDRQGVVVYFSLEGSLTWEDRLRWQKSDRVLQHLMETGQPQVGITQLDVPGGEWIVARAPIAGASWVAGAARPVDAVLSPVRRSLLQDVLLALLVFGLAFLAAYLLAQTIARPLHRLELDALAMEALPIGAGKLQTRDDPQASTEVRSLRSTVEGMATGLIQRAEALRESEARFRQLADAMPQLVWTAQPDGTVEYYNQRYREYEGISPSGSQIWGWAPVLHPEDVGPTVEAWGRAVETGEVYQCEHRVRVAGGEYRWHLSRGIPARDERGQIIRWYGTATDIHDMKLYTDQLERSNRDLQEFAFMASHDLQEPLRKIEILADSVIQKADGLDEHLRDRMLRMRRAADRMRGMVEGLFRYYLSTTQKQAFIPVDLSQTIAAVLSESEIRIQEASGTVEVGAMPVVEADAAQIQSLFQNLVDNALKFQPPGGKPRVKIYSRQSTPDQVQILIEDNGIGFDDSRAKRLFQPFRRLSIQTGSGGMEYPGSGIGLAICRRIVENHGGEITGQGKPGQGATFMVTLPLRCSIPLR